MHGYLDIVTHGYHRVRVPIAHHRRLGGNPHLGGMSGFLPGVMGLHMAGPALGGPVVGGLVHVRVVIWASITPGLHRVVGGTSEAKAHEGNDKQCE